jgi:hypothetical protein
MNEKRLMGLMQTSLSGCPEEWIKWKMAFRDIESLMLLKEPSDKIRMFQTLLKGQALSYFEHHLRRRVGAEDSELSDNELIELVLGDVGLEYIHKRHTRSKVLYEAVREFIYGS